MPDTRPSEPAGRGAVPPGAAGRSDPAGPSRPGRGVRHEMLRDVTAGPHAFAETIVEGAGYFSGPGGFGDYLRRMHLFYLAVADGAAPEMRGHLRRWRIPDRIDWLMRDLADLGVAPVPRHPQITLRPALSNDTQMLGALYVMVGSTLGSRVLVRKASSIGLPPGLGLTYLSSMAADKSWPLFLQHLEREPITSIEDLAAGALVTFESVAEHLSKVVPT